MTSYRVALLAGDGIGPEVCGVARACVDALGRRFDYDVTWLEAPVGGAAIDAHATPLPDDTLAACRDADAVLLGAIGGPKWDDPTAAVRPEDALLRLRSELQLFANLRPVRAHDGLSESSPLRAEVRRGADLLIVRELTGGLYFGRPQGRLEVDGQAAAVDTLRYTRPEIERIVELALELATGRRGHVTSVDKANVLASSRLWREVVDEVALRHPDVEVEHALVDSTAYLLMADPGRFDVIVTENLFGDILSDEAAAIAGSLGLLPSASLRSTVDGSRTLRDVRAGPRQRPADRGPRHRQPARDRGQRGDDAEALVRRDRGRGRPRGGHAPDDRGGPRTPDVGGTATSADVAGFLLEQLGAPAGVAA